MSRDSRHLALVVVGLLLLSSAAMAYGLGHAADNGTAITLGHCLGVSAGLVAYLVHRINVRNEDK